MKKALLVALITALASIMVAACSGAEEAEPTTAPAAAPAATTAPVATIAPSTPRPAPTAAPADGPVYGGVLTMQGGDPATWHPYKARGTGTIAASSPQYNQLVQWGPYNMQEIGPDLAESWSVSGDGGTYTFRLRSGLTWEPGRPVTADDVMFSLDAMKASGATRAALWVPFAESWQKVDDLTVQINLTSPAAPFLGYLAIDYPKILPKYLADQGFDFEDPEKIVGTGPFKFSNFRKGDSYELIKNPNYFREDLPYVDKVQVFHIRDKGTYIAAFKTGRVLMQNQAYPAVTAQEAKVLSQEMSDTHKFWPNYPGTHYSLLININETPFQDPKIRKALHLATDRQEFVQLFSDPDITKIGLAFPPDTWYGRPTEEALQLPGYRQPKDEDIAEAKKLLAAAGYTNGFSTSFMVSAGKDTDRAVVFKEQMKKIGVDVVDIETVDSNAMLANLAERKFTLNTFGPGIVINDPDAIISDSYRLGAFRNYVDWSNPKVEQLAALQRAESDQARRAEILREMEDFLESWEDNWWINLWWEPDLWLASNKVGGMVAGAGHDFMKYDTLWVRP